MATMSRERRRSRGRGARHDGLSASAVEGLRSMNAADWDALVSPGSGPLEHGYLTAWEKVELQGLTSRPVIAHAPGSEKPVAACPGYLYDLDIPTVRSPKVSPVVHAIRRVWHGFLFARTYELGSPTPLTNPFLVPELERRPEAVRALIGTAVEEGERCDADFVLVQNFISREGPAADELKSLGFAGVPMLATGVVDLPYDSFDDYLGAMRSQYRRRARQAFKRSKDLSLEHVSDFSEHADELARLWGLIYERASEIKREILTPEFFRAASQVDDATVLMMRRPDGSIASFGLLLADRPWLSFIQCGFEEEAGREEGAYFRLLYEIVRLGIEEGYDQVDLGVTTLEPKLDVGAVPVPLYGWVRHANPVFQRGLKALAHGPMKPPKVEARNVFKEGARSPSEIIEARKLPG